MTHQACVSLPVLNLYAQPHAASEVVSQALYGWNVLVLEESKNFYYIQTSDGYQGWVEAQGLIPLPASWKQSRMLKVMYNAVPVYPAPHVKYKPLQILPFEVKLPVLAEPVDEERRWIQVEVIEGTIGWIQRGHISFDFSALSMVQMLELSNQFLGLPYIWGGTSSFGYDCSGFIQMLWRQRGVYLARDARQQIQEKICFSIPKEHLEPGDLLFYGSSEKDIRHVGLYLGNQILIHASVKPIPIVQKSHLDDPSLSQRFAYQTARRVLLK